MERSSVGVRQYYVAVGEADAKLTTLVELLQALEVDTRLALAVTCSSRDSVDAVVHALTACKGFNIGVLHADLELHDMEQQILQLRGRLPNQQAEVASVGLQQNDGQQRHQQQQPQPHSHQQPGTPADTATQSDITAAADPAVSVTSNSLLSSTSAAVADNASLSSDNRSLAIVTSDVVLKHLSRELLPLGLPLLIQYDVPQSKEILQRRLAAVFGSSKERGRRAGKQVVIDFVAAGEVAAFRARERMTGASVLEMPVHVPDIFS